MLASFLVTAFAMVVFCGLLYFAAVALLNRRASREMEAAYRDADFARKRLSPFAVCGQTIERLTTAIVSRLSAASEAFEREADSESRTASGKA